MSYLLAALLRVLRVLRRTLLNSRHPAHKLLRSAELPPPLPPNETVVCVSMQPWAVHSAMLQHRSQYVWFRKLYVLVARHVWVSDLLRVA